MSVINALFRLKAADQPELELCKQLARHRMASERMMLAQRQHS